MLINLVVDGSFLKRTTNMSESSENSGRPASSSSGQTQRINRREYLAKSTVIGSAAAASALSLAQPYAAGAWLPGKQVIKIGLVGCGARGAGAAAQALTTGPDVQLWAMADAFSDRLERSLTSLQRGRAGRSQVEPGEGFGDAIDVPPERRWVGLDAYRKLIDSDVDLVILTGPPGFRPAHFNYAVNAGKHVFMEKPVATDAGGVRKILESAKKAKEQNLKVGVGLQRHHQDSYQDAIRRIHDGEIGRITAMRCFWNGSAPAKTPVPKENMTELEYQVRNWYFFDWLSGDHICEQHIHNVDICNWAMNAYPVSALGMGGRQVRTGKEYGNIFDHHAVIYTYANGTTMHSYCRQIPGCKNFVGEQIEGSLGRAHLGTVNCSLLHVDESGTEKPHWKSTRKRGNGSQGPYHVEWDVMVDAVLNDRPHAEAENGAKSSMTAILGRMATYSGKVVQWDEAVASTRTPAVDPLQWNAEAPVQPLPDGSYRIAKPGVTEVL